MYRFVRPLFFRLSPERAQSLALAIPRLCGAVRAATGMRNSLPGTALDLLGLNFPNPIGLAAGFDKSAQHIDALGSLGFGFIEVGTVTPRAQSGNPSPNLFRLREDEALINRMGFNNDGAKVIVERLERRRYTGVCGVNIGKNAVTPLEHASRDYLECLRAVYACADYVTVNVSSPNTPGLRTLQGAERLRALLLDLTHEREKLAGMHAKRLPLLVKLSPDLSDPELDSVTSVLREAQIDGIVATNTTTRRPATLRSAHATEPGGLSGRPLHEMSMQLIQGLRTRLGSHYPIIGVGGIMSAEDGADTLVAGANLLQLYTGLIYHGPRLVKALLTQVKISSPS